MTEPSFENQLDIARFNLNAEQSRIQMLLAIAETANRVSDFGDCELAVRVRDGALTALLQSLYPPMQVTQESDGQD